MNTRKIFAITVALTKSQLRASRTSKIGLGFFRRPYSLLVIDAVAFFACSAVGYLAAVAISLFPSVHDQALQALKEGLVFIPALVPSMVLIAGILFELNVSSKFSASDTVNWLPVTQAEYVAASALSVAYDYSVGVAIALGATVIPSIDFGLGWTWAGMAIVSLVMLFAGGALVEIVRATINRVSSVVMGKARRGALVLRLVLTVGIILVFEFIFNFSFLLGIIATFRSTLSVTAFVPLFWGSLVVEGILTGQLLYVVLFSFLTVGFVGFLVWAAVKVRSKYWSPTPTTVRITTSEYVPRASGLLKFGLTSTEAAVVRKDLKGATRRRELLSFFAIPLVIAAVFVFEIYVGGTTSASGASGFVTDYPIWFIGGFFGLMISSISFGQESKAVMVLYSLPISPRELLRAKAFLALSISVAATLATAIIFSLLGGATFVDAFENVVIGVSIAVEEVCIGLAFGASHPDFQERPRPRFVDPIWLIVMMLVGVGVLFATALPIIVRDVIGAIPGAAFPVDYFFPVAVVFAAAVSALFYRSATKSVETLMSEYRI
jgi:predicted permease